VFTWNRQTVSRNRQVFSWNRQVFSWNLSFHASYYPKIACTSQAITRNQFCHLKLVFAHKNDTWNKC
jgi:hypothetical protein